jgi:hypothetical protein
MIMEHWWNDNDRGTPKYSEREKYVTVPFYPSQIPHGLNLGLNPSLRGGIPATDHGNRGAVRFLVIYRGADKSLARPGRKQATATEDFDVHISYL